MIQSNHITHKGPQTQKVKKPHMHGTHPECTDGIPENINQLNLYEKKPADIIQLRIQINPVTFVSQANGINDITIMKLNAIDLTILKVLADHFENGVPHPSIITVAFLEGPGPKPNSGNQNLQETKPYIYIYRFWE